MAVDPIEDALAAARAETGRYEPYEPNLAQTVGYEPVHTYDDYMRPRTDLNFPAVQSNGSVYMPEGVRDAYLNQGIPPVLNNQGGFTNVAWRTFVNPWGQMLVQPMIGAATRYPHVVSGVPTDFQNTMGYINSLLGPLPMYQPMMQPPAWAMPKQARAPRTSGGGGGSTGRESNKTSTTSQSQPEQITFPHIFPRPPRVGWGDPMQSDAMAGPQARRAFPPSTSAATPPPDLGSAGWGQPLATMSTPAPVAAPTVSQSAPVAPSPLQEDALRYLQERATPIRPAPTPSVAPQMTQTPMPQFIPQLRIDPRYMP